jgi:translation initiation factor 2 beta subunit (eIF-2beta)/eIF-5
MIKNPNTNKMIKIGGKTHLHLISNNTLSRDTLDINKVSIVTNSRQKMPIPVIEFHKKSTHWLNFSKIVKSINCDKYELIEYLRKEFDKLKIIINKEEFIIIFPGREIFLSDVIKDFIKIYTEENNIDWNQ